MINEIVVKGAKVNNLRNVNVTIPRDKLVVFTGLSGSGKSSLAFDTIFAEGQRRYIESLSSYARQFLGQMDKPDVESIDGLSPAISIDQKTTSKNPRSTVGTVTEIYDYMRLLYARIGIPHCPNCGREIVKQSVDQIADRVMQEKEGSKIRIIAPVVRGRKGEYKQQLESYKKRGYMRVIVDGNDYTLDEDIELEKNNKHSISIVVDRLIVKDGIQRRLSDSLENALKLADGLVEIETNGQSKLVSTNYTCPDCEISIEELEPRLFSFNSPYGACPKCLGLAYTNKIDVNKVVKWDKTINEGALNVSGWNMDMYNTASSMFQALSEKYKFSLNIPVKNLKKNILDILLYGTKDKLDIKYKSSAFAGVMTKSFEGVINNLERRYRETQSDYMKAELEKLMMLVPCDVCNGKRLKKEALAVTINGKNIDELCSMSIEKLNNFFENIVLDKTQAMIAKQVVKEIKARLTFLINVGLDYLTLSRASGTLSGGESQRIRLATQIGSGLTGVLYILDEPSIGLHQRDNNKLLSALENLRDLGNTLIVVEHDEDTMRRADWIVDIGPGAGINGGQIVCEGTAKDIEKCENSITGQYLSGKRKISIPLCRRTGNGKFLEIKGARKNNLKNIDVKIPLGEFNVVTGVSGSGKSSLVNEIIYPTLQNLLNGSAKIETECDGVFGV